jgi:DNA-binding MarR family transcriptional regulator
MPVRLKFRNAKLNAWMLLRHTFYSIVKCEDELYTQTGLTSQQLAVLMAIKQMPKPVTQTDIANWMDRDTASVTLLIDRMVKKELVTRMRDLDDRRAVRLVITDKGERLFNQAKDPTVRQLLDIMSCLTEDETRVFIGLMEKIRDKTYSYRNVMDRVKEIELNSDDEDEFPWPA